jgi:hypothetical protein
MATVPGFVEGDEKEDEIVLKKGDGVEANYGGKGKRFSGTISAVNEDSSYDKRAIPASRTTRRAHPPSTPPPRQGVRKSM